MDIPDYLRPALAIALTEARHAAGLTQPQLADFSGLARSYVAALEGGTTSCSLESLYALTRALQLDPADFLARVDDLRAMRPSISNPGRGGKRVISFAAEAGKDDEDDTPAP